MLLTFDPAGQGARDDAAAPICGDLITDEDSPLEPWFHMRRLRDAFYIEETQILPSCKDTSLSICVPREERNDALLASFHSCTRRAANPISSFHGICSRCGGRPHPGLLCKFLVESLCRGGGCRCRGRGCRCRGVKVNPACRYKLEKHGLQFAQNPYSQRGQ